MWGEAVVSASNEELAFRSLPAVGTGTVTIGTGRFGGRTAVRSASFARPFDPSHLHTFVLLI
jgi:hypothetical protein